MIKTINLYDNDYDLLENTGVSLICLDREKQFSIAYNDHFIITIRNSHLHLYYDMTYINYSPTKDTFIFNKVIKLSDLVKIKKSPFELSLGNGKLDFSDVSEKDFIIDYDLNFLEDKIKKLESLRVFI